MGVALAGPRRVVGLCVRLHIRPNQVTLAGLVLVIIAGISFVTGQYGIGLTARDRLHDLFGHCGRQTGPRDSDIQQIRPLL